MFDRSMSVIGEMTSPVRRLSVRDARKRGATKHSRLIESLESRQMLSATIVHSFTATEGAYPAGGVIMDSSGNLFGNTTQGGTNNSGTLYELIKGTGTYTYKKLFGFDLISNASKGGAPSGKMVFDSSGNLFGRKRVERAACVFAKTLFGGRAGGGRVPGGPADSA